MRAAARVPVVSIVVDHQQVSAPGGVTVAAALLDLGVWSFRRSVSGASRGPVCGMGVCFECRVTVNDIAHQRACLVAVKDGMRIETSAGGA